VFIFCGVFPLLGFDEMSGFGFAYSLPLVIFFIAAIVQGGYMNVRISGFELLLIVILYMVMLDAFFVEHPSRFVTHILLILVVLFFGYYQVGKLKAKSVSTKDLEEASAKLHEANTELVNVDKNRREFISIASHQLRTSPATIKWYTAALLAGDYGQLPIQTRDALTKIKIANETQINIIDDMLNVSRIERGSLEFNFETGDILSLLARVVEDFRPLAAQKGLVLVLDRPKEEVLNVKMDTEKISHVISNFVDNAIKYSDTGMIRVSAVKSDSSVLVKVQDQGMGMDTAMKEKLFEKYARGQKGKSEGLGLGLYLARIIIENHNGRIWAESDGIGLGSKFFIELPIK